MTDHIRLWGLQLKMIVDLPVLFVTGNRPRYWLCKNPELDIELINNGYAVIYFWRTDRELVNCLRCLAVLKQLENDIEEDN